MLLLPILQNSHLLAACHGRLVGAGAPAYQQVNFDYLIHET